VETPVIPPPEAEEKDSVYHETKENSQKCSDVGEEPKHLIHDFNLLNVLHNTHAHTHPARIRQIIRGMQLNDPHWP
jgi:hypothetical protein